MTPTPANERLRFRIIINPSRLIVQGNDILGDVVHIAARREGLFYAGGICAAKAVSDGLDAHFSEAMHPMAQ